MKLSWMLCAMFLLFSLSASSALVPSAPLTYEVSSDQQAQPYLIGGVPFISSGLSYKFGCSDAGRYVAPAPASSCWLSQVSFGDLTGVMADGDSLQINPCVSVRMRAEGVAENGQLLGTSRNYQWKVAYAFNITDPDCLKSSFSAQSGIYELNQPAKIAITTQNKFGNITGGFYVAYQPLLYSAEYDYFVPASFSPGSSDLLVLLPSTVLGAANVSVYPYLYFGSAYVIQNVPANRAIQMLPHLQLQNLTSECSNDNGCVQDKRCVTVDSIGACMPKEKAPVTPAASPLLIWVGAGSVLAAVTFLFLLWRRIRT